MATEENTYFLRSFLLLVEGGLYISRETLGRECQKAGGNLDTLLKQCENKLKHEFHGKQYDKLFPQYGTTDINKWDLQLSVGVLINVFGRSLSLTEKQKLRALRDLRNEIYMHCASASLDQKKYEEVQEELEDIITTLAATFDKTVRDRCSAYITQFATGPLDGVKPSIATLNGFSQTCQKKLKVGLHTELVVGGPSDYWINLCENTLDTILNNAESMASEGAGFEEIEKNVKKMLEFLLANKNVVFKRSKKECIILMFECNSYDDALLFLQTLDSQEFRDHLSRISDALLRHYQFDATISISARVRTECFQSILIDILKIYRSEEIAHRQLEISSENETDDKGDHAKLMRGSEEEDSQKAESKQPLKLDLECTSKSGLLHFLNSFKKDDFSGHLKSVADALSKHFGKTITLKASLDIDDVMAAIEEAVSRDSTRCMTLQHGSEAIDLHEEELESDSFSDKITQRKKIGEREETTAKWVYDTSFDFAILTDKQEPIASVSYLSPNKPEECSVRGELDEDFDSSFRDIENESKLINELLLSAKTGNFQRVWEIIGEPNNPKKAYLLNCIPDSCRWGVLHQAVYWNDVNILKKLLRFKACDSDIRTKRCPSECGDMSGMCALEIARVYKYPDMDRILSAHRNNILGQKLPTFQKQPYLGLLSNTIAAYKSTFHPMYISPYKTGHEILNDIWKDINSNNTRFAMVKNQVCDAVHIVSTANADMIQGTTTKEDFYNMIVKAYTIETNSLYNNISMAMRRQTSTNYMPTGDDLALGPYAVMYQMLLLFWDKISPESGTTYRQMKMVKEDIDMYKEGTEFYWQSVVSSTKDEVNAQSFPTVEAVPGDNIVLFTIDNSAKCDWQPKNIEKYASHNRNERTYPAGAKFRVTSSAKFCQENFQVKLTLLAQ